MMFKRYMGKKQKQTSWKISGHIASVNDYKVVVNLSGEAIPYRKGQRIVLSIPSERTTASGKVLKVSEVVAHGRITDISNESVTIQSRRANPIISRAALNESKGKKLDMFVEDVD